jgi:DNA polymerase-3 subunit epsilon
LATGAGANHQGLELYRTKLKAAMEDRLIDDQEFRDLLEIVASEQISPSQAHELHAGYFQECASKALADGRIDSSEERDLARVAQVLTIDTSLVPELIATAPPPDQIASESMSGRTVCFTGAVDATRNGVPIAREELTEAAISVGMVPKSGVSKKLDILVAADPHSLSGKARKARELGIRIVTAEAFLTMIGYATD